MLLKRNEWFIREHIAVLKLTDTYDIIDPASGAMLGIAREEPPAWAKYMRLLLSKKLMPSIVNIYPGEGVPPIMTIHRGVAWWSTKVSVRRANGTEIGYFKSKVFSLGGGFYVFDSMGRQVAEIRGDWKGWNFRFIGIDGSTLGTVSKKWAGIGKELFTTADNYMIALNASAPSGEDPRALLLAAGLAIDLVFKEKN
ncbi:MAG TPA: phospholipid scramblase-related protein [Myxococcota bacterium]|nr:phospholipid scramblase-related protein [Myxococcota bacterium]HQP95091.1 phospholipid scramblase-related protein [Myxococcota bacterium]